MIYRRLTFVSTNFRFTVFFEDAFVILKSEFETEVDAINDAFHAPAAADISGKTVRKTLNIIKP